MKFNVLVRMTMELMVH